MPPPDPSADAAEARGAWRRDRWWLAFVLVAVGWHGLFFLRPQWHGAFGLAPYPLHMDSMALLAAGEAAQQGLDVYRPHSFDPFHRPHSYPSLWLVLGTLGLTRADNAWFGPLTVAAGLLAALLLLRPRTPAQAAEALVAVGGPGMIMATYRANNDLWIFALLSLLVPSLLHPSRLARFAATFIVAFGTALKYYPLVAGVLLLAEPDRRERRFRLLVLGLLLLIVGLGIAEDLAHLRTTQPTVGRFWSFGAVLGLRDLGLAYPALWSVALGALVAGSGIVRRAAPATWGDAWREPAFLCFLLGAVVLCGCFWAGGNWGYRWIFVLWLLPWLWRERGGGVGWTLVRYGWWVPMWFAPVLTRFVSGTGRGYRWVDHAWWLSQGLEWVWFGTLTALVASAVWQRLRLRPGMTAALA